MKHLRPLALSLMLGLSFTAIAADSGFAQAAKKAPAKQAEPAPAPAPEPPLKQIALTIAFAKESPRLNAELSGP